MGIIKTIKLFDFFKVTMSYDLDKYSSELIKAQKSDLDALSGLAIHAFKNYPMWQHFFPIDQERIKKGKLAFKTVIAYGLKYGYCYYLPDYLGMIEYFTSDHVPIKIFGLLRTGALRTLGAGFHFLRESAKMDNIIIERHKKVIQEPHIYLHLLAVDSQHQNKKIGSRLLKPLIELCKDLNLPLFLETHDPKNVPRYEHFGFKLMDSFPLLKTNLINYAMLKNTN
jgi:GNAT superfamily N-acetyltransferase